LEGNSGEVQQILWFVDDFKGKICFQVKMLKHNKAKNTQPSLAMSPVLAELSLNLTLDGSFDQSGVLSFEKLQVALENTKLTFYGGLYEFIKDSKIQKAKMVKNSEPGKGENESPSVYDKFVRFSSLIPKMLQVGVQNTTFSIIRENKSHNHDYIANVKTVSLNWKMSFSVDNSSFAFTSSYFSYEMSELVVDAASERLLALDQHTIDLKLNNEVINVYTKLKSLKLTYNHCDIIDWIKKNLVNSKLLPNPLQLKESSPQAFPSKGLEKLLGNCVIKLCVELWNISTICQLSNNQVSSINLAHTQLLLNQTEDKKAEKKATHFLSSRNWNAEIMIESLCFYLDSNVKNVSGSNLKKTHVRGSAFYIGVLLSKISDYATHKKIDLTAHTLRTEYSKALSGFIVEASKCIKEYSILRREKAPKPKIEGKNLLKELLGDKLVSNLKITDITTFFINQHDMCSFVNLPEITISLSNSKQIVELEKMQVSFVDFSKNASINSLSDHSNTFVSTKHIRLERSKQENSLLIYIVHNVEAFWSPNRHMHLTTLGKEIQEFTSEVAKILEIEKKPQPTVQPPRDLPKIDLYIKEQLTFGIDISSKHSMSGKVSNIYASTKKGMNFSIRNVQIAIDSTRMFEIDDITINSLDELAVLTEERKNYEQFKLPVNKVWAVKIDSFKGIFPYDHDFSSAIKDEFVSIYKWLKILHNYKKKPFTEQSPLPRDLIIQ
jgi:hypothetical protein